MELNNDFEVSAPIEKVWEVINDVELIAPCLPGAQLGRRWRATKRLDI